jgi:hypothetical protein
LRILSLSTRCLSTLSSFTYLQKQKKVFFSFLSMTMSSFIYLLFVNRKKDLTFEDSYRLGACVLFFFDDSTLIDLVLCTFFSLYCVFCYFFSVFFLLLRMLQRTHSIYMRVYWFLFFFSFLLLLSMETRRRRSREI